MGLSSAPALLALALLAAAPEGAPEAGIEDLVPLVRSDGLFVSFRARGLFDEEIEHAIRTGLQVEFRYNVELKRPRGIWFDARIAGRRITTSVAYDNLTKRYKLTREIDGQIDATEVVSDAEAMRRFMTTFESLRLFDLSHLSPNDPHYVRVKAVTRERSLLLLVPWDVGTEWKEARFHYLP